MRKIFGPFIFWGHLACFIVNLKRQDTNAAGIYLLKVNNGNTKTMCEICSKLIIKTPEQRRWRHSLVFIININIFHTLFCFLCWLWKSKCWLWSDTKMMTLLFHSLHYSFHWAPIYWRSFKNRQNRLYFSKKVKSYKKLLISFKLIKSFVPNVTFLYLLKTLENRMLFWCSIGNKEVKHDRIMLMALLFY